MTVLLDSWAWMEYFFGSPKGKVVQELLDDPAEPILTTKINVFEVFHKLLKTRGREVAERHAHFLLARCHLDDLDVDTIKLACEEKHKLGLGMADAVILATALKHGARVYTGDRDFERAKGLVDVVFL